jgi:hypothetical protein
MSICVDRMTAFLRDYVGKAAMQAQKYRWLCASIGSNSQFEPPHSQQHCGLNSLVDGLGLTLSVL